MKRFLLNFLLFSVLFCALNFGLNLFLSPYYGNPCYARKQAYFRQNMDKYNTLIMGSSRFYRHINPQRLDALLADRQVSSFNIAAPSTHNPEMYYLLEDLLESIPTGRLKYILVELQPLNEIADKNLHTKKNYYWHNWDYLLYAYRYIRASHYNRGKKIAFLKNYLISYANKIMRLYLPDGLDFKRPGEEDLYLGEKNNGFYPLDEELNNSDETPLLGERVAAFQANTSVLGERAAMAAQAFAEEDLEQYLNAVHLKKIKGLIDMARQKGCQMIFVIPPRRPVYREVLAMKNTLPEKQVLELADPKKYPELYQTAYSFDVGHLNKKGADKFTEYLARELKTRIK